MDARFGGMTTRRVRVGDEKGDTRSAQCDGCDVTDDKGRVDGEKSKGDQPGVCASEVCQVPPFSLISRGRHATAVLVFQRFRRYPASHHCRQADSNTSMHRLQLTAYMPHSDYNQAAHRAGANLQTLKSGGWRD